MGLRGPQRDPDSRRGRAEASKDIALTLLDATPPGVPSTDEPTGPGNLPTCPKDLPARVEAKWRKLLRGMVQAKVPIRQVDDEAILQAARCLVAIEQLEGLIESGELDAKGTMACISAKMKAIAESGKWLERICATPGSRVRIGMKTVPDKKPGPIQKLLEEKARRA